MSDTAAISGRLWDPLKFVMLQTPTVCGRLQCLHSPPSHSTLRMAVCDNQGLQYRPQVMSRVLMVKTLKTDPRFVEKPNWQLQCGVQAEANFRRRAGAGDSREDFVNGLCGRGY